MKILVTNVVRLTKLKHWIRKLVYPIPVLPKDTETGQINPQVIGVLLATTEALLVGNSIEIEHYEKFFCWHSENLQGYKQLYEKFSKTVDQEATNLVGHSFTACDVEVRLKILEKAFRTRNLNIKLDRLRMSLFEKDWLLFDQYIIQEILSLFARSDAWILVGYKSWPGMSRGLEEYKKMPAKIKADDSLSNA